MKSLTFITIFLIAMFILMFIVMVILMFIPKEKYDTLSIKFRNHRYDRHRMRSNPHVRSYQHQ